MGDDERVDTKDESEELVAAEENEPSVMGLARNDDSAKACGVIISALCLCTWGVSLDP